MILQRRVCFCAVLGTCPGQPQHTLRVLIFVTTCVRLLNSPSDPCDCLADLGFVVYNGFLFYGNSVCVCVSKTGVFAQFVSVCNSSMGGAEHKEGERKGSPPFQWSCVWQNSLWLFCLKEISIGSWEKPQRLPS